LDFLSNNLPALILMVAGFGLVALIVMQSMQISAMRTRMDKLTGGMDEGSIEDVLIEHLESVHAVGQELDELIARVAFLESSARHHYSRQGLVRFDAMQFPDTGGKQSFALALLDESNDGVIVSSLHSRTGTRIYAKSVVAGKTDTALSAEETQAIDEAMSRRPATSPSAKARAAATAREAGRGSAKASQAPVPGRSPRSVPAAPVAPAAPAPRPAPVVPAPVAAPEPEPEPEPEAAPEVAPAAFEDAEPSREMVARPPVNKGQTKGEALPPADDDSADAERTGARPGRSAAPRP
jgi:hypothetical protein